MQQFFSAWCQKSEPAARISSGCETNIELDSQEIPRALLYMLSHKLGRAILAGTGGQRTVSGLGRLHLCLLILHCKSDEDSSQEASYEQRCPSELFTRVHGKEELDKNFFTSNFLYIALYYMYT